MAAHLSVVIPALNEAEVLPRLLHALQQQTDVALQIVVADGGSSDGTVQAVQQAGVGLLQLARGRGRQMNAGARATHGEQLLFLHADSELPDAGLLAQALAALRQHCAADGTFRVAGHFPLQFRRAEPGHERFFRYLEGKTRLNRRYTINGDQGLLIPRRYFEELGGFDEALPFLEDALLADRIFTTGRWILLPGYLRTSARRFETEGHRERYTLMAIVMGLAAGGLWRFFERAPQAYREQARAGRLQLADFAAPVRATLRELSWRPRLAALYRVGRFVRQNSWQLFYARDQRRGDASLRCTRWHDRWFEPLVDNALGNSLAMLLVCAWFFAWLPLQLRRSGA